MAYTTVTAIRTALENVIEALNPSAPTMKRDRYKKLATNKTWDDRSLPESEIDRRFSVGSITPANHTMFGVIEEREWKGSFPVMIGHAKGTNKDQALERRNEDYIQVVTALNKKGNYPIGVLLIAPASTRTIRDDDKFWITEISFDIIFVLEAP